MESMRSLALSRQRQVDVLMLSDLRFPGGTSHSLAEEIAAQAEAGWSTGLIHVNGPLLSWLRPVNPRIRDQVRRGRAKLFVGDRPIRAKLVVVRHPAVLQAAGQLPQIDTEHAVLVANAPPTDFDGHRHYQPQVVDRIARERFGVAPIWAPIGPLARESVAPDIPAGLRAEDWVNIIDVDPWRVDRPEWRADRPVIGRHSRPSPQKWPIDPKVIETVYPVDGSTTVKILGGADPVRDVLGYVPNSWQVSPFGAIDPRQFLAQLDFFVYFHHPAWVEAFGRNILEAMASGLPAILPPHFRPLFGDAAIYAEPAEVPSVLSRLYADRTAYEEIVGRALASVRARFGYQAHQHRLAELIGTPEAVATDEPTRSSPIRAAAHKRPSLLLISSNGSGMGHLTRLIAYARRAQPDLAPHFLSLSQAVSVVGTFGFPFEYLPSAGATGLSSRRWHELFAERVSDAVARLRPAVVVFDGTWPYHGIPRVREAHPAARWVWSRRGMWRRGMNPEQLDKAVWFDMVLAPGELAEAYDHGLTSYADGVRVGPVTLVDEAELDDRETARRALGLPLDRRVALVALGAGNINDTSQQTGAVVAAVQRLGVDVCVTQTEIAESNRTRASVHVVRDFPLSRRFRAFDLAVSAAGYNSFHELLRFGVPTLFIPNQDTALDDQQGRAQFAADRGLAHMLSGVSVSAATLLLRDLLQHGQQMVANVPLIDRGNGAAAAAMHLRRLAEVEPARA